jgi:uncharacterized protein (DUF488 family)
MVVFTIGHSSHTLDAFTGLLRGVGVTQLADVRRWPRSRRHPHFDDDALAVELASSGVAYTHLPELGGHRERVAGSPNDAWDVPAFNAYADHLASEEFARGLDRLLALAAARPAAVMCAEGDWRRCHRRLVADVLVARGLADVGHVTPDGAVVAHTVNDVAVGEGGGPQLGLGF